MAYLGVALLSMCLLQVAAQNRQSFLPFEENFMVASYDNGHPLFHLIFLRTNYDKPGFKNMMYEKEYLFEQAVITQISRSFKECNMVDVGMNAGYLTVLAGTLGCNVESFEASPKTYNIAAQSIRLNRLKRHVKAHNLAVTNDRSVKEVSFLVQKNGVYDMIVNENNKHDHLKPESIKRVKTVYLDDYFESRDEITLFKIDCEGCESAAVHSLTNTLRKRSVKMFLFEWVPVRMFLSPQKMIQLLEQNGYIIYDTRGQKYDTKSESFYTIQVGDVFAVRSDIDFAKFINQVQTLRVELDKGTLDKRD